MKSLIEKLHMHHVRQFNNVEISFNDRFNFLVGPNGCGKTSVLAGISHCFSDNYEYSRFSDQSEFWVDLVFEDTQYRIGLGQGAIESSGYRQARLRNHISPPRSEGRYTHAVYWARSNIPAAAPLFIGAQRRIAYKQISGVQREPEQLEKVNTYINNSTRSLYGDWQSDIKQWLINRYFMIDKDWATEEKENWTHLISNLPFLAPFDSKFQYIRTARDLEPIFSIYGRESYLEEISSGFQAVLLIIANIFEWIEGSREPGNRLVKHARGTVLIDELDLHLHPEWQFTIRDGLSRLFPYLQFIVTTHSPHLLASAKPNEVIVMPARSVENESYDLRPINRSFSGWNTDQILAELMGVKSLENKEYEKLIHSALEACERRSVNDLKAIIEQLEMVAHPNDTVIVVLKARLATLEVMSND